MKKTYQKPVMEFENFRLDVDIASRNPAYDAAMDAYREIYGDKIPTEAEFQQFLRDYTMLDPNDGYCYHTAYVPS